MYHGYILGSYENERGETVHNVMIWSTVADPPSSMSQVKNIGDDVKLAVGSSFLYPDGGEVQFWLSDEAWHRWGG